MRACFKLSWSSTSHREYYNDDGAARQTAGVDIHIVMPREGTLDGLKSLMYSLFEEVCPVQLEEKTSGKEENGKMVEDISIRGRLKELRYTEKQRAEHHGEKM